MQTFTFKQAGKVVCVVVTDLDKRKLSDDDDAGMPPWAIAEQMVRLAEITAGCIDSDDASWYVAKAGTKDWRYLDPVRASNPDDKTSSDLAGKEAWTRDSIRLKVFNVNRDSRGKEVFLEID